MHCTYNGPTIITPPICHTRRPRGSQAQGVLKSSQTYGVPGRKVHTVSFQRQQGVGSVSTRGSRILRKRETTGNPSFVAVHASTLCARYKELSPYGCVVSLQLGLSLYGWDCLFTDGIVTLQLVNRSRLFQFNMVPLYTLLKGPGRFCFSPAHWKRNLS